jgi:hypothetical protein
VRRKKPLGTPEQYLSSQPGYTDAMLKLAWHPRNNVVAIAGTYKLFLYQGRPVPQRGGSICVPSGGSSSLGSPLLTPLSPSLASAMLSPAAHTAFPSSPFLPAAAVNSQQALPSLSRSMSAGNKASSAPSAVPAPAQVSPPSLTPTPPVAPVPLALPLALNPSAPADAAPRKVLLSPPHMPLTVAPSRKQGSGKPRKPKAKAQAAQSDEGDASADKPTGKSAAKRRSSAANTVDPSASSL